MSNNTTNPTSPNATVPPMDIKYSSATAKKAAMKREKSDAQWAAEERRRDEDVERQKRAAVRGHTGDRHMFYDTKWDI